MYCCSVGCFKVELLDIGFGCYDLYAFLWMVVGCMVFVVGTGVNWFLVVCVFD